MKITYAKGKDMCTETKFCVVCGRRIPELSLRKITCSKACYKRKKGGYAPYTDYKKPPYEDLTALQQKAQEKNMSYGKYMAMLYNARMKGEQL